MTENRLAWGKPGHEREYCLRVDKGTHPQMYDDRDFILAAHSKTLAELLGDSFEVLNRGTRIEISPKSELWDSRADELLQDGVHEAVHSAVKQIFGATGLEINHVEPMPVAQEVTCEESGCGENLPSAVRLRIHMMREHGLRP